MGSVDAEWLKNFCVVIMSLIVSVAGLLSIFRRKTRVSAEMEDQFVTRREFDKLEIHLNSRLQDILIAVEKLGTKTETMVQGVAKTAYEGRKAIHKTVGGIQAHLARVDAKVEGLEKNHG